MLSLISSPNCKESHQWEVNHPLGIQEIHVRNMTGGKLNPNFEGCFVEDAQSNPVKKYEWV